MVQAVPVLALLGYALPPAARPKWGLWLAIAGITAALAVSAPGNWLRLIASTPPDRLHAYRWLVLGPRTAYSMVQFLMQPIIALSLLAAAAGGLWLGFQSRQHSTFQVLLSRRQWWVLMLAFSVLNTVGFLLFRYLIVGPPLARARNEILLLMLISVMALAWLAATQLPALARLAPRLRTAPALLLLAGLFGAGHTPEAWRELCFSAASFNTQMQARFAALRAAHRTGQPAIVLPPLRLPYGRVLIPLHQFSHDIEFDLDLKPGCEGIINGVMERYFDVPDVCCDAAAPAPAPPQ